MNLKIIVILFFTIALSLAEFVDEILDLNTGNMKFSRFFKRHNLKFHFKIDDAEFEGIVDPVVERLENEIRNATWYLAYYNNAYKCSADSRINDNEIEIPLREIMKLRDDTRDIVILIGGHDDALGNNWIKVTDVLAPSSIPPRVIRKPWKYISDFWIEDVEQFIGRIDDEFLILKWRISTINIADISVNIFKHIVQSDTHVILAFDFGRNDRAYRKYLRLEPVNSKVYAPRYKSHYFAPDSIFKHINNFTSFYHSDQQITRLFNKK